MAELGGPDPLRYYVVARCDWGPLGETPVIDQLFRVATATWEPTSTTGKHAGSAITSPAPRKRADGTFQLFEASDWLRET